MFYWSDLQLEIFGWLINSLDKEEKPPEYTIPKYFTGRGHGITQRLNQACLWDGGHFPLWSVKPYLEGGKEWHSIDGDPEKFFCSKIHVHLYWCISSSFKMIITVRISCEET